MYFNYNSFVNLEDIINPAYKMYAHRKKNSEGEEQIKETLQEHTKRAETYFIEIIQNKKLEHFFDKIENVFLGDLSIETRDIYKKMILNTVTFHDVGKINPVFQSKKMNNAIAPGGKPIVGIGNSSHHSSLSAAVYVDYFIKAMGVLSSKEKKIIRVFMYVNAYLISRHHSDLGDVFDFFRKEYETFEVMKNVRGQENPYLNNILHFGKTSMTDDLKRIKIFLTAFLNENSERDERKAYLYTYSRLLYSVLVASDYYATTEFTNGLQITNFGELSDINEFYNIYKKTNRFIGIESYRKIRYGKCESFNNIDDINVLRNELFLDAEKGLQENLDKNVFFLEAPTGGGKSNISMNLSFKLLEKDKSLKKIYYVYPFNTLVEQNYTTLKDIFCDENTVLDKIVTINSVTPIKQTSQKVVGVSNTESNEVLYSKDLLNRQFLNYPFILTTSVSLFNILFGAEQSDVFAFHQLANSIIVLDEIQSYKNSIWAEIIIFLNCYAELLNIKVIIMSATLPNLNAFLDNKMSVVNVIEDKEKFFQHPVFKNRVNTHYELLESNEVLIDLLEMVRDKSELNKRIVIEFITKQSAGKFFEILCEEKESGRIKLPLLYISGDNNATERNHILQNVKDKKTKGEGVILVATQVIEAGIDIDMEIGFKDISKLDSEEQFMGRINRSCFEANAGDVYFFDLDPAGKIYKHDVRISKELGLKNLEMRKILESKDYWSYYSLVIEQIIEEYNKAGSTYNLKEFFKKSVLRMDFKDIADRMRLIDEDKGQVSVFLARVLHDDENQITIDGRQIWKEYVEMLQSDMSFAKKAVLMSKIRSQMNNFIYQVRAESNISYNDRIGELYYIEEGEIFFINGSLSREKLENGNLFLD